MATYQVGSKRISPDDPAFASVITEAYQQKIHPRCLCNSHSPSMYISRFAGRYLLKRMPNTGDQHAVGCDSYEPPPELSGLGDVLGSAIQEDTLDGTTAIRLAFSMSKKPGRAPPQSNAEHDSVKTDGKKLTLRGLLHYLWGEAGFNRWSPAMTGKRNWFVLRKFLCGALDGKKTKAGDLGGRVYIPEKFSPEHKLEIQQRRDALLASGENQEKNIQPLKIVIGEVKELTTARFGHKIIFKHVPDRHFMLNEDMNKRLQKRFFTELELWNSIEESHLMAIGTFQVSSNGVPSFEELALMLVSKEWIPFESLDESTLIAALVNGQRRFMKTLRYNLPQSQPLAAAVISDTDPATALYLFPPGASDEYRKGVADLIENSKLNSWQWEVSAVLPSLPPVSQPPFAV